METEQAVARHYAREGLEAAILQALRNGGQDVEQLGPDDLAGVDEFHLGWRAATEALGRALALTPDERVLDLGSGLGGLARYFAHTYGCRVTGVDLTPDFVAAAESLTRRCDLAGKVTFRVGNILDLSFEEGSFDAATLVHVGMNIADKARLFAQARRVLRPGGRFAVYDIMQVEPGPLPYPMPWAETEAISFVATPAAYREQLKAAGFTLRSERSHASLAKELGREMRERAARDGPPALSLHLVIGPATPQRLGNVMRTLEAGTIEPIEMIADAG
jgi:ubiquinone/menaquinone biosynthesis C-methylase UbiE